MNVAPGNWGRRSVRVSLLCLLAAAALGCRQEEQSAPPSRPAPVQEEQPAEQGRTAPAKDAPNLLLLTLDTTRADRLGCYGYAAAQTPALDAIAARGVRVEQAYCAVPLTLPSHVSLLTGTYPPANGIRVNGGGMLSAELPTLAEEFQIRGYRTGAFVAAWVLSATFGLDRGFDHYDDDVGGHDGSTEIGSERPADAVCDAALDWLDRQPDVPFFAWVHFFDPHTPYAPPPGYRQASADPYDGEITFMDAQLGRLTAWLDERQLREKTLIVVAGDHGESFDEHGETEHGMLIYDTTLHVPLIFSFPARLPAGTVLSTGGRLTDVFPTVADLLGWKAPPGTDGISLTPALRAGEGRFPTTYAESRYPRQSFGWAALRSLITAEWKYIDAPQPELYDRDGDAQELTNLI